MTDNEIIKALECCSVDPNSGKHADCKNCPLDILGSADCFWFVIQKNALDLINRQKAEIERLKSMNQAKLDMIRDIRAELETAKAEAIKEFAGRIEQKLAANTDISAVGYQSIIADIDNASKEMVGEE